MKFYLLTEKKVLRPFFTVNNILLGVFFNKKRSFLLKKTPKQNYLGWVKTCLAGRQARNEFLHNP